MARGGSLLSTLYKERSNSWQLQKILAVEKDADAIFKALDLLGQDDTVKFDATAYTIGISACAKVAQTQRACELLNASLRAKVEADVVCFNAAISACDKGEKWQEAFRLLDRMHHSKLEANVRSFSGAISSCTNVAWQHAVSMHHQMSKAHVEPNIYSFSACITSTEKSALWSLALAYVKHMKKATVQPNVVNLNAALGACSKEGTAMWPLAVSLWANICLEVEPNVITFTTAMTSHITMWSWPRSLNFLELMPQTHAGPNMFTFSTAINICKRGEWPWATALLEKMSKDFRLQRNLVCFNACINDASWGGTWSCAVRVLDSMEQAAVYPDSLSLTGTMKSCQRNGKWQDALRLFEEGSKFSYVSALSACATGKEWQQAFQQLLPQMVRKRMPLDVIEFNVSMSCVRCWEEVLGVLELMAEQQAHPDSVTYNTAMHECQMEEAWPASLSLFSLMGDAKVQRQDVTYNSLLLGL